MIWASVTKCSWVQIKAERLDSTFKKGKKRIARYLSKPINYEMIWKNLKYYQLIGTWLQNQRVAGSSSTQTVWSTDWLPVHWNPNCSQGALTLTQLINVKYWNISVSQTTNMGSIIHRWCYMVSVIHESNISWCHLTHIYNVYTKEHNASTSLTLLSLLTL